MGKAVEEAMGPPPNAEFEAVEAELPPDALEERLVLAAVNELVGPNNWLADVPPETKPDEPLVADAPVRI